MGTVAGMSSGETRRGKRRGEFRLWNQGMCYVLQKDCVGDRRHEKISNVSITGAWERVTSTVFEVD